MGWGEQEPREPDAEENMIAQPEHYTSRMGKSQSHTLHPQRYIDHIDDYRHQNITGDLIFLYICTSVHHIFWSERKQTFV